MKMKRITVVTIIVIILSLAAFLGITKLTAADNDNQNTNDQWQQTLLKERQKKDLEFKISPTSPMAAVKRMTLTPLAPGVETFVISNNRDFSLSQEKAPGARFSLAFKNDRWIWNAIVPGVVCQVSGKDVESGSPLDRESQFRVDGCVLGAYPSKKGLALIVYDQERPVFKQFSHLLYYPPDPAFAVPAKLVRFKVPTTITILTSQNLEKTYYRFGEVHFRVGGKDLRLTALKYSLDGDGSDYLFIPFGDKTNGKDTYGSGRFLDVPEPAGEDFILDFNRCYNPLCNYAHDAYNCPLPPYENILDAPIEAGEKTYTH